jgi:hypothetical protein
MMEKEILHSAYVFAIAAVAASDSESRSVVRRFFGVGLTIVQERPAPLPAAPKPMAETTTFITVSRKMRLPVSRPAAAGHHQRQQIIGMRLHLACVQRFQPVLQQGVALRRRFLRHRGPASRRSAR